MKSRPTLRFGTPEEAGMLPERVAVAREVMARAVAQASTPSAVVLAARRGVIFLHQAFGVLRPGGPSLPLDGIWPIASVTKSITATLVMTLVEDGLVSPSNPARVYLPELSGDGIDDVLVHHLLNHTSGFEDEPVLVHVAKKYAEQGAPELPEHWHPMHHGVLSLAWDAPRSAPAGEAMFYSNINYTLLGELVARVAGKPLEQYARERLFEPLAMKDTDYVLRDPMRERLVERSPELPLGSVFVSEIPGFETEAWRRMPDGGVGAYSSAMDLAVLAQMFSNQGSYAAARILSRPAVIEMTEDRCPGLGVKFGNLTMREASYGYGFMVKADDRWTYFSASLPARGSYGHSGAGGADFWIDPVNEIVGVTLEVVTDISGDLEHRSGHKQFFQNAITSAVAD